MSVIATALKHMLAAGMPAEAIVAAVAEMEAGIVAQAVVEAQPSKGALRQRRYEERKRQKASESVSHDADLTKMTENVTEPLALSPNENNSNPHTHTPEGVTPRARKAGPTWPCPDGVNPKHWADFLANRRAKRLACTDTAHDGQLRRLAELADAEWPPGRIVQHAAEHGWAGIHDPRKSQDRHHGNASRPRFHDRPSGWAPRPGMAGAEPASLDD